MKKFPVVLFSVSLASPAFAQRDLKELPPVDPAAQLASFQLAPGLGINLFAQEPLIAKPIQMAWDEKGRLWVASSSIYPHIKPGQTQADKILVIEDTDHDGKADKSTVFYEGLLIPTGILPGDGGAYVANSTELLFMKDTDGDGRADETKVLLSGFGTEDTHHIIHSIKRGPDGAIYFAQSVYIHTRMETPYGLRALGGSGWWQYRPETGRAEVYSMGQVNPWGMIWNREGQTFTTDGAYGEGINYTFPGATFLCLPNQLPRILKGLNPGQPKHAGLEIITGGHFPEEMQGQMITNDFRGHRVNRFAVKDEGSGFSSQQLEDVVRSTHGSFRPVDARMGPDGALYLADWYNPIIQHGEVDFHDPRRDHEHGRIWRITAKDRAPLVRPDYAKLDVTELLRLLRDSAEWVRTHAKREITDRVRRDGPGVLENAPAMIAQAAQGLEEGSSELERFALELCWLTQNIFVSSEGSQHIVEILQRVIKANDFRVRAAGVRVAGMLAKTGELKLAGLEDMVRGILADSQPRVRLEAVNALRAEGSARAVELAALALDQPMDENLDFALWLTCRELADTWLPAFRKGDITFGGNVAHIAFALKAADRPEAVGALLDLVRDGKVTGPKTGEALQLVGALGGPPDMARLLELAGAPNASAALVTSVYDALTTAARQRKVKPEAGGDAVVKSLENADAAVRAAAARLAGAWKLETARAVLESQAKAAAPEAAEAVAALGGDASKTFLTALAAETADPAKKAGVMSALISLDAAAAAPAVADFLAALGEPAASAAVYDAYLARKDGPALLAAALKDKKIPEATAAAGVRRASATGGDTKGLVEALTLAGGLQPVGMALTPEDLTKMIAEVKSQGNAARGEEIYRRQALLCQSCHAIGAVGGIVGPDLLSIGSSAPVDYIIESLIEPSKKIKEGYATTVVNTKDGGVFSGFLVREDAREVLLRDATGVTQSVPAADVASKQSIPVSLMPPALTAGLRRDEFVDLVRFMSELGKEGAYKVQADGFIRRWRALQPADELRQLTNRDGLRALAAEQPDLTWLPAYSRVKGELALEQLPVLQLWQIQARAAQADLDVTTAGAVVLKFAAPAGMKAFLNGQEITPAAEVKLDLPVGKHRLTLVLDPKAATAPVTVEALAAPGSGARIVPVGGV